MKIIVDAEQLSAAMGKVQRLCPRAINDREAVCLEVDGNSIVLFRNNYESYAEVVVPAVASNEAHFTIADPQVLSFCRGELSLVTRDSGIEFRAENGYEGVLNYSQADFDRDTPATEPNIPFPNLKPILWMALKEEYHIYTYVYLGRQTIATIDGIGHAVIAAPSPFGDPVVLLSEYANRIPTDALASYSINQYGNGKLWLRSDDTLVAIPSIRFDWDGSTIYDRLGDWQVAGSVEIAQGDLKRRLEYALVVSESQQNPGGLCRLFTVDGKLVIESIGNEIGQGSAQVEPISISGKIDTYMRPRQFIPALSSTGEPALLEKVFNDRGAALRLTIGDVIVMYSEVARR